MGDTIESLGLSYAVILKAYQSFFDDGIMFDILSGIKFLAIVFFVLSVSTNMISSMGGSWTGEVKLPYNKNKLLVSLAFVLLIAFFDKFTMLIDNILLPLDTYFNKFETLSLTEAASEEIRETTDETWMSIFKKYASYQVSLLSGGMQEYVLGFFLFIAKIIDSMIYVVFLVERFFFLGLLKILGPFAILFSIYSAKKDMFEKWFKMYVAVYLLIIPFYLILGFTAELIKTINLRLASQSAVVDIMFGKAVLTVAIMLIIWIKLRLFKKSYDIVYKIIS